jgi:hypothetical protein
VQKIDLVELNKVVERYPTCCERELVENSDTLQVPQRDIGFTGCESELRETNLCVSFVVCLTSWFLAYLLYFCFDLLGCAYLCVQGSLPYL